MTIPTGLYGNRNLSHMDWLNQLRNAAQRRLAFQSQRALRYQRYYDNQSGIIALLNTEERMTFKTFLAESSANWCELVVNSVAERLQVEGFTFGSPTDDDLAWTIWQASQMDADSSLVQLDALTMASSFVLVQPDDDNPTGVSITVESPMQATVLYEPGNRRKRIAGYKRFGPDYLWPYVDSTSAISAAQPGATEVLVTPDEIVTWEPGMSRDGPMIEPNPSGAVPMVEIIPQPRTLLPPRSELESAMTIQDRINTTLFNRMVATDYGAFRQVWATGIRVAASVVKTSTANADGSTTTTPQAVVRPFDVGANRLLTNENPDGRFGSFPESTLAGYLSSVSQDIEQLAAITQTPPYYLTGQMVNLSADAIKAAEAGLVAKCKRRAVHIGEGWEEVMRIALALVGSPAATNLGAEVIWADMETRSVAQMVDAVLKMGSLGIPTEVLWAKLGASPQEIAAWKDMRKAEGLPAVPPPEPPATATMVLPAPQQPGQPAPVPVPVGTPQPPSPQPAPPPAPPPKPAP